MDFLQTQSGSAALTQASVYTTPLPPVLPWASPKHSRTRPTTVRALSAPSPAFLRSKADCCLSCCPRHPPPPADPPRYCLAPRCPPMMEELTGLLQSRATCLEHLGLLWLQELRRGDNSPRGTFLVRSTEPVSILSVFLPFFPEPLKPG